MASGAWKAYNKFKFRIGDGTIDLDDTTNWKCALFLSTSNCNTLSVGTNIYADLTNEHANGNGYTTGGVAVTPTWTDSSGTETFNITAPIVWNASGGSIVARYAVIYKNATVNTIVKPLGLVCLLDTTPADRTATTGQAFTINPHASGLWTLSGMTSD
jgi:hypothetical protein